MAKATVILTSEVQTCPRCHGNGSMPAWHRNEGICELCDGGKLPSATTAIARKLASLGRALEEIEQEAANWKINMEAAQAKGRSGRHQAEQIERLRGTWRRIAARRHEIETQATRVRVSRAAGIEFLTNEGKVVRE